MRLKRKAGLWVPGVTDFEVLVMPWNVKAWYRDRVLKNESLPDDLWRHAVAVCGSCAG